MPAATWTYTPNQVAPLKISRSRLQLFLDCPRCFWLLMRQNIKRPSWPDFSLNLAVDQLLKREFDDYRSQGKAHPVMKKYKIKGLPFEHADLENWRNNFKGIQYLVEKFNFLIFGAVDDIWINGDDELIIVDYKATAKDKPVEALYAEGTYHDSYRRQMDIYNWLFLMNGFKTSPQTYFLYLTGDLGQPKLAGKLHFISHLIGYEVETTWIEPVLAEVKACLDQDLPKYQPDKCEHCNYVLQRLRSIHRLKQHEKN